jgi:hypothetical protein
VRSSELESGIETDAFVPLKESAFPNFPAVDHVALEIVPLLPLPDRSTVVDPLPSSNPYEAIAVPPTIVALASFDAGPTLPATSSAVTL